MPNSTQMARNGPAALVGKGPLVEAKRKWRCAAAKAAFDPERTSNRLAVPSENAVHFRRPLHKDKLSLFLIVSRRETLAANLNGVLDCYLASERLSFSGKQEVPFRE
jgi:hypothetical protein